MSVATEPLDGFHVIDLSSILQQMDDMIPCRPNLNCLFGTATEQHGYFTAAQAKACGYSRYLLSHQTRSGQFLRIRRGIYRFRDYPSFPREEVVEAWLSTGKDSSVVSHESALDLLELSDVIPHAIHITVPRSRRHLSPISGVTIHTTTRPFEPTDIVELDGIRLTSAKRTILDSAEWGTGPEQIELAIWQALRRGLVTRSQLLSAASERSQRVLQHVSGALETTAA